MRVNTVGQATLPLAYPRGAHGTGACGPEVCGAGPALWDTLPPSPLPREALQLHSSPGLEAAPPRRPGRLRSCPHGPTGRALCPQSARGQALAQDSVFRENVHYAGRE